MLFSSYTFLFQFLPATALAFAAARLHSPRAGIMVLAGASLIFYGAWKPAYLVVLLASIGCNFLLGLQMEDPARRRSDVEDIGVRFDDREIVYAAAHNGRAEVPPGKRFNEQFIGIVSLARKGRRETKCAET